MTRRRRRAGRAPRGAAAAAVAVPLAPRRLWGLLGGGFALLGAAAGVLWAVAAGIPQAAAMGLVTAGARMGLVVRHVQLEGVVYQPRLAIYREVLDGGSDAMALLDIKAVRRRLIALDWVRDAEVRRRWPDRVEVRIVERQPAALWQHRGTLRLIDAEGVILPAGDLADFAGLPLLVGQGADREAGALLTLVSRHPAVAGRMEAAVRVADRRWDLRMASGEVISLPEDREAPAALLRFADMDRQTPLLGRGFVRFDLRVPDRMVVRVETETGELPRPRVSREAPAGRVSPGGMTA